MAAAATRVLLRNSFAPARYVLALEPDLQRFTFDGNVSIVGRVNKSTSSIILHAKELSITSASFSTSEKKQVAATQIKHNLKEHTVEFVFSEALPEGEGTLSIPYVGQLNNQMAGFYRSGYTAIDGTKKIMASTQFEPLDCRRAVPCVDEPAEKVRWLSVCVVVCFALFTFTLPPLVSSQTPSTLIYYLE
jgi:aminopeptidase N